MRTVLITIFICFIFMIITNKYYEYKKEKSYISGYIDGFNKSEKIKEVIRSLEQRKRYR